MTTFSYTHLVRAESAPEAEELATKHELQHGTWGWLPFTVEDHYPAVYERKAGELPSISEKEWAELSAEEQRKTSASDYFKLYMLVASDRLTAEELADDAKLELDAWGFLGFDGVSEPIIYKMLPVYSEL